MLLHFITVLSGNELFCLEFVQVIFAIGEAEVHKLISFPVHFEIEDAFSYTWNYSRTVIDPMNCYISVKYNEFTYF